ncbi:MAG: hypothetical protein QOD71_1608 [Thermoleophilaceae bacterium]|nr:hypothetical protein [Thermoleophilaceae bacterium]
MRIEKQVDIQAPPERVFAFLADSENMPQWQTALDQVEQVSPGAPCKGTSYRFASSDPPLESTIEWVEFDENRKLAWHGPPARVGPGSIQFTGSHTLEPLDGGGTRLRSIFETKFGGVLKAIGPLRGRLIAKEIEDDLRRLKSLLERASASFVLLFQDFPLPAFG